MSRDRAFTTLLHKGLIQNFGQDRYDCPIPSLRTYVEKICAQNSCAIQTVEAPPVRELSGGM